MEVSTWKTPEALSRLTHTHTHTHTSSALLCSEPVVLMLRGSRERGGGGYLHHSYADSTRFDSFCSCRRTHRGHRCVRRLTRGRQRLRRSHNGGLATGRSPVRSPVPPDLNERVYERANPRRCREAMHTMCTSGAFWLGSIETRDSYLAVCPHAVNTWR